MGFGSWTAHSQQTEHFLASYAKSDLLFTLYTNSFDDVLLLRVTIPPTHEAKHHGCESLIEKLESSIWESSQIQQFSHIP